MALTREIGDHAPVAEPLTGRAIQAGRMLLGWSVNDLARESKVHRTTIVKIEGGGGALERTVDSLRHALEHAGVEFLQRGAPGPRELKLEDGTLVRLKPRP